MHAQPALTHAAIELFGGPMMPDSGPALRKTQPSQADVQIELGIYDVIGAHVLGFPPSFGRYDNCHAERRCLGCERSCGGEKGLVDLAESRGRPLLLVLVGGRPGYPTWLRVIAIDPGKGWSGSIFAPVSFRHQRGVVLEPVSGGACLVVTAEGLLVSELKPGKPWLVAAFDRARLSFCASLHRSRALVDDAAGGFGDFEGFGA